MDVGDIVDGKYELTNLIGKGGMGAVYAATNKLIGKRVAVKVLHSSFAEDEEVLQRFLQEARAAATLENAGCVEIFDFGWAQHAGEGFPYIVMELMRGKSLSQAMEDDGGALEIEFAVSLTLDVLSVLVSVHGKKIIHRDLKPENIFLAIELDGTKRTKILDFGISKVRTDQDGGLTQTGMLLGTPYYMSPEQACGHKNIDHRIDIWAMGAILYQMLTDRVPFPGSSYNEILSKIVKEDLELPRSFRPGLPEWLEAVVLRAMAWNRDDRYRSAEDFRKDLQSRWNENLTRTPPTVMSRRSVSDSGSSIEDDVSATLKGVRATVATSQEARLTPTAVVPDALEPSTKFVAPAESVDSLAFTAATPAQVDNSQEWSVTPAAKDLKSTVLGPSVDSLSASVRNASRRRGRRTFFRPVLGIVAVVVILAGAVVGGLMYRPNGDDPEPERNSVVATPVTPEPALPPQVETSTVTPEPAPPPQIEPPTVPVQDPEATLTLTGVPGPARILVDDTEVESPEIRRPRSTEPHQIRVELENHQPWIRTVSFDQDASLAVALVPLPEAETPGQPEVESPSRHKRNSSNDSLRNRRSRDSSARRSRHRGRFDSEFD